MGLTQRWREIRSGFERPFWIANTTEIFERVAYYGTTAVLAIYLTEQLHFSSELATTLLGIAGFVVYALSILAGTLADRFGFRRTLMAAYLLLTVGYFLLGSLESSWMAPLRRAVGDIGWHGIDGPADSIRLVPGLVKPCVVGTTARASTENVRSLGYSDLLLHAREHRRRGGSADGLGEVRQKLGWGSANVFRMAALSVFLMFWVTLLFFRGPGRSR